MTPAGVLGSTSIYRVAMALRFDAQLPSPMRVLTLFPNIDESVRLIFVSNGTSIQAQLNAVLVDGGAAYREPPQLVAPIGAYGLWHTVSLNVDLDRKTLTLSVDGVARPSANFSDVRLDTPASPIVRFGSDYSPGLVRDNAVALDTLLLEPR